MSPRRSDVPRCGPRADAGFSITELLVASVLILLIIGAIAAVAVPATEAAHSQPEATDLQQRARAAASALFRDLHGAGAGLDVGAGAGPLSGSFAAVLPRRLGAESADAPETARADVVTILRVPETVVQSTVVAPFSTSPLAIRQEPGCPSTQSACGARQGMGLVVFDSSGTFDLFTVESVSPAGAVLRARAAAPPGHVYGDTARVAEIDARTYYFDAAARQLRQYDTDRTDVPLMDDVVSMTVEYFGTALPPSAPRPAAGEGNCLYDASGSALPGLQLLPADSFELARLPLDMFRDGPWCGVGEMRYDADLLRVRRLHVALRLQTTSPGLRAAGDRFVLGGTARSATRTVPDLVVAFDVTPRNLGLPR